MLCGICIHDTRSRQRIHLLVCHDGRTHRLDYRVGPGTGIHRSRNHGKHQLEPLSGRLSRGTGHTSTASPHRLSLGWWSRKYPRLPYRRADEPLPDTGYGRQLHLQRLHCIPEGFRHTDFCHTRLEIHQYRQLYTLHPCQYGRAGRIWLLRHPARGGHRILRLPRIRRREHSRPRDEEPEAEHAYRHSGLLAGMHRALYGFCPRHDGSGTLHRLQRTARYCSRCHSHRAHGAG